MNPFSAGDEVIFISDDRIAALLAFSDLSDLKPSGRYIIAATNGDGVVIRGFENSPGGWIYYNVFELTEGREDRRHWAYRIDKMPVTEAELQEALKSDVIIGSLKRTTGIRGGDKPQKIIDELIANKLQRVAERDGGWTLLLEDRMNHTYWELTYPELRQNYAGPRKLIRIDAETAASLYRMDRSEQDLSEEH
jgi:hypothetical protein